MSKLKNWSIEKSIRCPPIDQVVELKFHFLPRSLILSYVYIFCYINVEDINTKPRILIFYAVTIVENVLLVVLWTLSVKASLDFEKSDRQNVIVSVVGLFFGGIAFMLLYYKLFHVSKLGNGEPEVDQTGNGNNCRTSLVPTQKSGCGSGNQVRWTLRK